MKITYITIILLVLSQFAFGQLPQYGEMLLGTGMSGPQIYQGQSVDVSGDGTVAVVGGYLDNNQIGAIWVYSFDGFSFKQLGNKLAPINETASQFGFSTAISKNGKIIVVGGPGCNSGIGAAWVYSFNGYNYVFLQKITSNDNGINTAFGYSVDISENGNIITIGGPFDDSIGAAWIFTLNGINYTQAGTKILPTNSIGIPQFGRGAKISEQGNMIAISGTGDDSEIGAVWVFSFDGTNIQYISKLIGSGYSTISGVSQGYAIALNENGTIIFSSGISDENSKGSTWGFSFNGVNFNQVASKFSANNSERGWSFGYSLDCSSDGKKVFVSAVGAFQGRGAVWEFNFDGANFVQNGNKFVLNDTTISPLPSLGVSLSITNNGDRVFVGANNFQPTQNYYTGSAWLFKERLNQSILGLNIPTNTNYGNAPIIQPKYASSNREITYSSVGNGAFVLGNTLYFIGEGVSTITATQIGDTYYKAAQTQVRIITVTGFQQTLASITGPLLVSITGLQSQITTLVSIINNTTSSSSNQDLINSILGLNAQLASLLGINTGASYLSSNPTELTIEDFASNYAVNISSNCTWQVNENADWLTVTPTSGTGNGFINVSVKRNATLAHRQTTISVSGCNTLLSSIAITQTASSPTSTNLPAYQSTIARNEAITVFPNPTDGAFTIQSANGFVEKVMIYSVYGTILKEIEPTNKTTFNITGLSAGVYIVKYIDKRIIVVVN